MLKNKILNILQFIYINKLYIYLYAKQKMRGGRFALVVGTPPP